VLPPHLIPGNPGNSGGKKGRSGRRPDKWKLWCQKVVSGKSAQREIRRVLRNRAHPAFATMVKFLGEQGFGKAEANVNVKGKMTLEDLVSASNDVAGDD
jgi:hypothetical protein